MKMMSLFARLFGWNQRKPHQAHAEDALGSAAAPLDTADAAINTAHQMGADGVSYASIEAALQRALAPVVVEMQSLHHLIGAMDHAGTARQPGVQAPEETGRAAIDRETIELAIEHALAHFYQLLRGREEFKAQPVFLKPTPDGNTALPLDPLLQHLLVVMHPLYPHMYTTLIVLPGTFTRVDRLGTLPNGVRVHSLHINERKAAPGFMDALRALHRENSENLFLGKLTATPGGRSEYQLEYFRCTGSDIRNADAEQFPGEQMMFFNDVPEPLIFRQRMEGVEDVFSALADLTQSAAPVASSDATHDDAAVEWNQQQSDGSAAL